MFNVVLFMQSTAYFVITNIAVLFNAYDIVSCYDLRTWRTPCLHILQFDPYWLIFGCWHYFARLPLYYTNDIKVSKEISKRVCIAHI